MKLKVSVFQKVATRLVVRDKSMGYRERLKLLDVTTLEIWRAQGDLIEVVKMFRRLEDIDLSSLCLSQDCVSYISHISN